jgi:hypothetical protein
VAVPSSRITGRCRFDERIVTAVIPETSATAS